VKILRPMKPKKSKKEKPVRELTPEERRQQHWQFILTALKLWIIQEDLILPNLEIVLNEAGKLLHHHRRLLGQLPEPVRGRMNSFP
jgi:hypothetical protein